MIAPSPPTDSGKREPASSAAAALTSGRLRQARLFVAPYPYPVTKTETRTQIVVTGTTSVTFKCTPATSILPACK